MKLHFAVCILALGLLVAPAPAEQSNPGSENNADQTLAPYFQVFSGSEGADVLPLKSTSVETVISGVIADVKVTQVYGNTGHQPLEAIYVFPASTRAAVQAMRMTIGDRVIQAKVQERSKAKETFETARRDGKSASLLEQQRPNVFQMSVTNIMPGDQIEVSLEYSELLVPTDSVYEFVFPTVVGPRYSNQPAATAPASEQWIANPYLQEGVNSPATFALSVKLNAGMPLRDVSCGTHPTKIDYVDANSATIMLEQGDAPGNNRDFILKYRLADDRIASGLLLHRGERENFFLMMVQPPKRVAPELIPPREYIFVIDVSGSMNGFPLDTAKTLVRNLASHLRETDRFNVVLFAGAARQLAPRSLPATRQNLERALEVIDRERGGGGTELGKGLGTALALPGEEDVSRSIVVITDGFISFETEAFDLVRENLNRANVFAFGIGSSVNRFLIEGLAHAGQGEPFVVTEPAQAPGAAARFAEYIKAPVLTGLDVEFKGFDAHALEPASLPDVLAQRPVILFGKWKGEPAGSITLHGHSGSGDFRETLDVRESAGQLSNPALEHLWARKRIETLSDYNWLQESDERVKEVTNLGLTHNLLTAYTSFVAVDEVVRNPGGNPQAVKQPLPLPAGVSNLAVGSAPTTPEPGTWLVLIAVAGVVGWTIYRRRERCAAGR